MPVPPITLARTITLVPPVVRPVRSCLAVALVLSALLPACRGPEQPAVLLGVIADLSGPGAEAGRGLRDGARLALRPARPGVGPLVQDDRGDPRRAARLARHLRDLEEVVAILAPASPAAAREVLRALDEGPPVPVLLPGPCAPELTAGRPWAFCLQPSADFLGEALAWFLVTRAGVDAAGVAFASGAWEEALAAGFSSELERLGGRVLFRREVDPARGWVSAADSVPATLLAGVEPVAPPPDPAVGRSAGAAPVLLAGPWFPFAPPADGREQAGESRAGTGRVLRPVLFDPGAGPRAREFARAFEAAFGRAPGPAAAMAYEGATLVVGALAAGAQTRGAVRESLASAGGEGSHEGLAGPFFFSRQRHAIREVVIGGAGGAVPVPSSRSRPRVRSPARRIARPRSPAP